MAAGTTVAAAWRRAWDRVIPFFAFPPTIRRVIYTTIAIESINAQLRNITADRGRAAHNWKEAMNQFAYFMKTASRSLTEPAGQG